MADFPAGTSPLPAGANVTVHFPNFTVAGNTDTLFYWNGVGAVNFQPISTTQPGVAVAVGADPVGTTSNTSADGLRFRSTSIRVSHWTMAAGQFRGRRLSERREHQRCGADGLQELLLRLDHRFADRQWRQSRASSEMRSYDHVDPPIVEGKDFTFVNNAISYVQNNLVPFRSRAASRWSAILACTLLSPSLRRRKPLHRQKELTPMNRKSVLLSLASIAIATGCRARDRPGPTPRCTEPTGERPVGNGHRRLRSRPMDVGGASFSSRLRQHIYANNNPGYNSIGAGSPDMPAGAQALPGNSVLSWDFLPDDDTKAMTACRRTCSIGTAKIRMAFLVSRQTT